MEHRDENEVLLSNLAITATSFVFIDFDGVNTTINTTQEGKVFTLIKCDSQIIIYNDNRRVILTKPIKFIKSIKAFNEQGCDVNFVRIVDADEGRQ